MTCPVCDAPMEDLRPRKAEGATKPLPGDLPDWRCTAAKNGEHAAPGEFPQWWLEATQRP
jgi:hypothetical protein